MYERRMNFILNWDTENFAYLEILDNDYYKLTLTNFHKKIMPLNWVSHLGKFKKKQELMIGF